MQRGASVPNVDDPVALVGFAARIEEAGWDGFLVWDGFQHHAAAGFATVDPWVLLGAVAGSTSRMLLGTGVTPVCRRTPWKLAKEVVTLDHLSAGRAVLGVGLGNPPEEEFVAFGDRSGLRERAARTDESLGLIDRLLRGEPVDHHGEHYEVHAHLRPACHRMPRAPIWIAATSPHRRPLERAARWDGVFCNFDPATEAPLTPGAVEAYTGRLAGEVDVITFRHDDHEPDEYAAVGVTWLLEIPWPSGPTWLADFEAQLRTVAG